MHKFAGMNVVDVGKDSDEVSHNIFKALRDHECYDLIIAQYIDNGDMVEGLFNRMIKSASGNLV